MEPRLPSRLCGGEFGAEELATIQEIVGSAEPRLRAEIARRVCDALGWQDTLGRAKLMSARVALLKLHRLGLIELPPARNGNGNAQALSRQKPTLPEAVAMEAPAGQLEDLHLARVESKELSALWNGLIDRYHYLGYQPMAGAQLRYLIRWRGGELGALGWGAAAWKVGPLDRLGCQDEGEAPGVGTEQCAVSDFTLDSFEESGFQSAGNECAAGEGGL